MGDLAAGPQFVRTPDDRFAELPDYPFQPHYHNWNGLRMHYLDEGSGSPIVLLHGQYSSHTLWVQVNRYDEWYSTLFQSSP